MISRIRIEAYGASASDVEAELLEFGKECDGMLEVQECAYGACVIERVLTETWGASDFAWKGRIILHPTIGTVPFIPIEIAREHPLAHADAGAVATASDESQ